MNKQYLPIIIIFGILIFLSIGAGLITGNVFLIKSVMNQKCTITNITSRNCYENQGKLYLEQYLIIAEKEIGFILCGPVLNCHTSPCNFNIVIGQEYWCFEYANIYRIVEYAPGKTIFGIIVIFILIIIWIISLIIFLYRNYYPYLWNYIPVSNDTHEIL